MRIFLASLQFLTILPLPIEPSEEELGKSIFFFPLVGFLIGIILTCIYWLGIRVLPFLVIIVLLMIVWIIITGALHLDGLADTLDGLYAGKTREKRLKIMRDKYIGVMGITAIVVILLLKYTLLLSVPVAHISKVLIFTPVLSRWGIVVALSMSPYVRKEGKGEMFSKSIQWWYAPFQGLILLVLAIWLFNFVNGISIVIGFLVFLWLSTIFFKKRIGGVTGDTLGAVNEIGEVLILLFIVLLKIA